jgi:decaprenylphospho-beta-D-erythro-pentofuranosid-2-ulose 2-reductase
LNDKRIVIIGATSAIAERCARLWAAEGPAAMLLVGRDTARLARVADDLRVRAPAAAIDTATVDFDDPAAIRALADGECARGPVDILLVAHGSLADQATCQEDLAEARASLLTNGVSPVLFAEAFAAPMQRADRGVIAIIGSVAGDRGRRSNYVYGAAKGLVTRYAQGLAHRFAGTGVGVVLVKPGPTDTPMTAHLKAKGARLAPAEDVAAAIVRGVAARTPVVYAPRRWALVMMVIRHLPRFVFDRMDI